MPASEPFLSFLCVQGVNGGLRVRDVKRLNVRDPAKARDELGWEAKYGIEDMCASSWKWQSTNPNGYRG